MRELTMDEVVLVSGAQESAPPPEKKPPADEERGIEPFFEPIGDAFDNPFSALGGWMDAVVQRAYEGGVRVGNGKGREVPEDYYDIPGGGEVQPYH